MQLRESLPVSWRATTPPTDRFVLVLQGCGTPHKELDRRLSTVSFLCIWLTLFFFVFFCRSQEQFSFFVKAEKCKFHTASVTFHRYVILRGQVNPDPEKIQPVQSLKTNSYSAFWALPISTGDYSRIVAPLTNLASPSSPFSWSYCWILQKELFTLAPILIQPDPALQFVVEIETSDTGVGAVLSKRSNADQTSPLCLLFQEVNSGWEELRPVW